MQSEGKIAVVLDTHHYCCCCHHNLYCIIITNAVVVVTVLSSGCYYGITAKWFSVLWCCWLGIWPIKTSASLLLGVTAVPCGQPRLLKLKGMSSYGLPWRYWEQECLEIEDWGATGKYTFTWKMAVKVARLIVVCHNFWNLVFFLVSLKIYLLMSQCCHSGAYKAVHRTNSCGQCVTCCQRNSIQGSVCLTVDSCVFEY